MEQKLTKKEQQALDQFREMTEEAEIFQVRELILSCDNKYQFAKTHSNFLKDWEKTRKKMEEQSQKGKLPPNTSIAFTKATIEIGEELIQKKLKMVREAFEDKFGESVYDGYLGPDGKTKKIFGIFG
ncbi:MAG: hypothetical protein KAI72_10005 [Candidatus Pacebacteria bacterium]|nr:hypothetical protein [Candidatus Paceibacterota bacterium]